jgi:hypothetical protein
MVGEGEKLNIGATTNQRPHPVTGVAAGLLDGLSLRANGADTITSSHRDLSDDHAMDSTPSRTVIADAFLNGGKSGT